MGDDLKAQIRDAFDQVAPVSVTELPPAGRAQPRHPAQRVVLVALLVGAVGLAAAGTWAIVAGTADRSQPIAVGAAVDDGRAIPPAWRSGADPDDPLFEDLQFRTLFGLSTDRAHIEAVREGWDEELGNAMLLPVAVTEEERAVVGALMELSGQFNALAPRIAELAGPGFAGQEISLPDELVTIRFQVGSDELQPGPFQDEVRALLPPALDVRYVEAEYTAAELAEHSATITAALGWLAEEGVDVTLHGVSQQTNRVDVVVSSDSPPAEHIFAELVPLDAINIIYSDMMVVRGSTTGYWEEWLARRSQ